MIDPSTGVGPTRAAAAVGVVLAGGASRRMGTDKTTLVVDTPGGPRSLVAWAAERLARVTPEVLVADRGRRLAPPWESVADGPGGGPAAGLLGAAAARPGRPLLALACDLPNVPVALLAALLAGTGDWVVPEHEGEAPGGAPRLEPLVALYRPAALEVLARRMARGEHALHPLAREPGLAVERLSGPRLEPFGRPEDLFLNLNRPEDLARSDGVSRRDGRGGASGE